MKNLKKISVAVLVLVALVTTVVITAIAADGSGSYTGTVQEAQKQLTAVSTLGTDAEKSAALVKLGAYIETVDPESEGFEAFAQSFNGVTYSVAWNLLGASDAVDASGTLADKTELYKALYAHISVAAILADYADDTMLSRWNNVKQIYSEKTFATAELWLAAVKTDKTVANTVALYDYLTKAPVAVDEFEGFAELADEYNTIAIELLAASLDSAVPNTAGLVAVLDQYKATPALDDYATAKVKEDLTKFKKAFDTKTIKAANDALVLITNEASCEQNTQDLKAVYDFVAGVALFDSASDENKALLTALNTKSLEVAKRYYALAEVVVGKPDSEEIPEFRKAVNELLSFLEKAPTIIYREKYPTSFTGSLADANALLDAVVASDYKTFTPLYAFMTTTPVDPAAEGAAVFYKKYEATTATVAEAVIAKIDALNAAPTVAGGTELDMAAFTVQLTNVMELSSFLQSTPFSLDVINAYNGKLHGFTKTLKANFDATFSSFTSVKSKLDNHLELCPIDEEKLAEDSGYDVLVENISVLNGYEAIRSITDLICSSSGTGLDSTRAALVRAVNDLMVAALLDYDELVSREHTALGSGSIEVVQSMMQEFNDAATAEAKAEIYAAIYLYLKDYPINPKLDGYDLFLGDYELAAQEVASYLIESIKTVEDMGRVHDYLEKTPVNAEAVESYNSKYLFIYRDALKTALASYETASAALHNFLKSPESEAAIAAVDGLSEALGNYEALETAALTQIYNLIYLDDTNGNISVIARGNAIRKLKAYANAYALPEGVYGYADIKADLEAAYADYDGILQYAKEELDAQTPFEEYNYTAYNYSVNWDEGLNPVKFYWSDNETGKNTGTHFEVVPDEKNGGYYWKTIYGNKNDAGQSPTGAFWGVTGIDSTRGIVMEIDIKGDDTYGIKNFYFRRIENPNRNSNGFFSIVENKVYAYIDGKKQSTPLIPDDVITPGEWTHFIMIYFPDEQMISLYADYQYLGKWSAIPPDYTVFTELRVQGSSTDDVICYDNFELYQGTHFRIRDKFDNMDDGQRFKYYVDYMSNANYNPTARLTAYQEASALYELFAENPEFKEYVDKYHSINVDADILGPAKAQNLALLKEQASVIDDYLSNPALITSANSTEIQATIDIIDNFIAVNAAYLDQASTEFTELVAKINAVKMQIDRCDTLISFVKALKQFDRAFSHAAKTRHYATAAKFYEEGDFRNADVRESLVNDPTVLEFERYLNGDMNPADAAYVDLFEYYGLCSSILDNRQVYENSGKIIDCLEFITNMDDYEATEEFWGANYDYIVKYMNIIRDLVKTNNYDPSYPGIDKAIEEFREIDVYFYEQLQVEHEAVLRELVNQYPLVNSYIEKLGICSSVAIYLGENDVDTSRPEILELVTRYTAYATELEAYKDDYADVLAQNTVYFINITERMKAYVNYANLKALYDEGAKYYYEMNSDSEAAIAAIAVFEEYGKRLAAIEEASAMFIGYSQEISSARNDGKLYEALVNCSQYLDGISVEVEGAEDALETYEKALAKYNAKYLPCNDEISEANTVVCAIRTNVIADAILSVIAAIFNK